MEAIYIPELNEFSTNLVIPYEESQHIKALRLKVGDNISVINGKGIIANCNLIDINKNQSSIQVNSVEFNVGETSINISVGIGILDNRDRIEFALEKAVELGVNHFYPLITDFTQRKTINIDRLQQKGIASLKQCKRSVLTEIHKPIKISELVESFNNFDYIILADEFGHKPSSLSAKNVLILVGPEGGFSKNEIEIIKKSANTICWNLGNRRLRAETALISTLACLNF